MLEVLSLILMRAMRYVSYLKVRRGFRIRRWLHESVRLLISDVRRLILEKFLIFLGQLFRNLLWRYDFLAQLFVSLFESFFKRLWRSYRKDKSLRRLYVARL